MEVGLQILPALHPGKMLLLVEKLASLFEEKRGIFRDKRADNGEGLRGGRTVVTPTKGKEEGCKEWWQEGDRCNS